MTTTKHIILFLKNSIDTFNKKTALGIVVMLLFTSKVFAQPANITITPASNIQTVGSSFTVFVALDFTGATPPLGTDAIEIHLAFDPTKLQVTAMSEQPTAAAFPFKLIPLEGAPFTSTNTNGQVNYAAVTTSGFPTADFNILSITFNVIGGAGTSTPLNLRRDFPANFTDAQRNGFSIVTTVVNGSVSINAPGCISPTATISAAPSCDANPFNLVLASSTVGTAPFDLTINGTTYNNIPVGGVITSFIPPTQRIWPATPAPIPSTYEDQALTLGVRFQSAVSGFVKGVRFFSPDDIPVAPGTFTGQLWTTSGTLLASGTFTSVTVDSWNELVFSDPVLISAGVTYVASYHTNDIKYAETPGGLTAPVVNGALTALAGGGLYLYGASAVFPTNANNNNYWVDVIFAPNNFSVNLTAVKDALECSSNGTPNLQTLNITSVECGTLPVSLLSFSASPGTNDVNLRWATSSEINNLGFEVQRSIDGNGGWTTLAFVDGAGNSTVTRNYTYLDENLTASRYYYRLKQVDIDQRFTYSPIVTAVLDGKRTYSLDQNFPNPFKNETIIRFTLPQQSKVNLSLFDMNGRLVKVLVNESKESGTHAVTLNSGALTSGLYYYKIQAGDFSAVKKMTIQ